MKVWFFNHYALPPSLHPITRTFNFAKNLIDKGYVPVIFCASTLHKTDVNLINDGRKYKVEENEGIEYVYVRTNNYKGNDKKRIINMIQFFMGLFRIIKKFDPPDIIIASSVHPLTCVAGIKIARKFKCRCIVEIADLWPRTLIDFGMIRKNGIIANTLYRLEYWIYKNADEIIFTMEGGKDYINDTFGNSKDINPSKIYYINNGIDYDKFNRDKNDCQYEDEDLDSKDLFKVVYAGSLGEANAANYIIESADLIQQKGYSNIKFLIFGSGMKKSELEEYCKTHKLDNVIFKGKVEKKYIPSILSRSDLNIFTGKNIDLYKYGLSLNKMFDYFASGKPTVSNINCGYDIIKKYNCGITVKGGSAETLAEGILKFYNMPKEEYEYYCKNALKAAQDFDFKVLTDKLEKVILED